MWFLGAGTIRMALWGKGRDSGIEVVAQTCRSRMWNQSDTGTSHSLPRCSRGTPTSNTLSAFLISVLSLPLCSWALQ